MELTWSQLGDNLELYEAQTWDPILAFNWFIDWTLLQLKRDDPNRLIRFNLNQARFDGVRLIRAMNHLTCIPSCSMLNAFTKKTFIFTHKDFFIQHIKLKKV